MPPPPRSRLPSMSSSTCSPRGRRRSMSLSNTTRALLQAAEKVFVVALRWERRASALRQTVERERGFTGCGKSLCRCLSVGAQGFSPAKTIERERGFTGCGKSLCRCLSVGAQGFSPAKTSATIRGFSPGPSLPGRNRTFSALSLGILLYLLIAGPNAVASGPRWVTGQPYFYPPGRMIVWYTDHPVYFTDPGDLSPSVNHAAADALVAAAAGVWTVSTSRLTLSYGGALDQHASSSNVYPSTSGLVFPSDVQSANYLAKQIAVLYDTDGAITDLMLGQGASDPTICRQNAVTESVDSISTSGQIQHAILVLNGRCTGPAPEQQLQLRYQLMRAFGRVVGLGWSQTNDNVFTGNPRPTYNQALHWPIMHPIDVICGPYTYQCMPQPFTLRDDDISGLGLLYPVWVFAPPRPAKRTPSPA